jgi:hypothetical protein
MPKITTTMRPNDEVEVTDREVVDLGRMGYLRTLDGKNVQRSQDKVAEQVASGEKKEGN